MNVSLYVSFLVAAAALILLPGPTAILVTSKSLRLGVRAGLTAVAGSTFAVAIQLVVVVVGLASVIVFVSGWFEWIRWIGVGYLIYLGIKTWILSAGITENVAKSASVAKSTFRDFTDGFVVTLTNPKTLFFLGAFLPQFVDPNYPALPQLGILAFSFLIVAAVLDSCWALFGARLGTFITRRQSHRLVGRVSGSVLIGAGTALALARHTE